MRESPAVAYFSSLKVMTVPLGQVIYASVKPIFKIYIIIVIGYFLAKRNVLSVTTCRDISDAIVTVILPCLIFDKIVSNIVSSDIKNLGIIFFEGTLLFTIGASIALGIFYLCKSPKAWFGGLISVGMFPNISDLPIAYLQTLASSGDLFTEEEGAKGVAYVCIFLASQVFFQFSLGLFRLIQYDFRDELKPKDPEQTAAASADQSASKNSLEEKTDSADQRHSWRSSELLTDNVSDTVEQDAPVEDVAEEAMENQQHDQFLMHHLEAVTSNPRSSISSATLYGTGNSIARHRTVGSATHLLNPVTSRAADLRLMRSQDIQDVINEYSEFDRLKTNEIRRTSTLTSEIGVEEVKPQLEKETLTHKILRHAWNTLKNFKTPSSVALIVSIAIAMAPPLKALFVESNFYIPSAPDKQPPLSFIMDFTSYVGAASVPLGLLLLGATIARLAVKSIVPGFWKTVVGVCACRLILLPIIGVGITTGLDKAGWYGTDDIIRFVSVLEFGLPNATSLVYITAFYTDPTASEHLQMDCLALCLIAQYVLLAVSLPFLVTFTLKVSLGF